MYILGILKFEGIFYFDLKRRGYFICNFNQFDDVSQYYVFKIPFFFGFCMFILIPTACQYIPNIISNLIVIDLILP